MKHIVTGGTGFVGSATIKALEKEGCDVFNFDLLRGYDVCNKQQLENVVQEGDKILHLAAISRFDFSDLDPPRAFAVNVGGTHNVLEVAKRNKAERVVFSSTGSIYMPVESVPIDENHRIEGNSVYGCSKAFADRLCQIFSKDMKVVILRYPYLYGAGKNWAGIYNFADRLKKGLEPMIHGGNQTNDFCYIEDIVQANLLALQTENVGVYNIGSGEEVNICDAVGTIQRTLGTDIEPIIVPSRSIDPMRFVYDVSKAKRLLGYEPRFNFEDGIKDYLGKGRVGEQFAIERLDKLLSMSKNLVTEHAQATLEHHLSEEASDLLKSVPEDQRRAYVRAFKQGGYDLNNTGKNENLWIFTGL